MKTVHLNMVNVLNTPTDVLHRVTSTEDSIWKSPYHYGKTPSEQNKAYIKYSHFLSNMLFLEEDLANTNPGTPEDQLRFKTAYKALLERAKQDGLLVFECTCYPGLCHLDALRETLTTALENDGYKVISNQDPITISAQPDEEL
jgi:hypothetical protein